MTISDEQPRQSEAGEGGVASPSQASTGEPKIPIVVLSIGFLIFGFVTGNLTGFSAMPGITQVLVTSIFSFVGGVLLSYAGLQKLGFRNAADGMRVGLLLACFSLGVLLGTPAGVYMRCNKQINSWFMGESIEHSQCYKKDKGFCSGGTTVNSGAMPMAATSDECKRAQRELSLGIARTEEKMKLFELFHEVIRSCGLDK